jgi:hypothetical protein
MDPENLAGIAKGEETMRQQSQQELFPAEGAHKNGPVECLGMTFQSDEA